MLKALTAPLWVQAWPESRDGTATALSQLIQQMDENVGSFQKACVFVSSSSQKLGVNLLVGCEGHIFFTVIAGLKKNKQNTRSDMNSDAHQHSERDPHDKQ